MKAIEVYSTYAQDRFVNSTGQILKESKGGPASFIVNVLQDLQIPFTIYSPEKIVVEILLTQNGEFGRIPMAPQKSQIKPAKNKILLISTLLNEWELWAGSSPIYLDVQGYVRNGTDFGKKQKWIVPKPLWGSLICIKGTKEEISCLDQEFLDEQKAKRQLIITRGALGADIFIQGRNFFIPAIKTTDLPDTVGAGDTWFAAYVAKQISGLGAKEAAEFATEYVARFLQGKNK